MDFSLFFSAAGIIALAVTVCILTTGCLTLISGVHKEAYKLKFGDDAEYNESILKLRAHLTVFRWTLRWACSFLAVLLVLLILFFVIFSFNGLGNLEVNRHFSTEYAQKTLGFLIRWDAFEIIYGIVLMYISMLVSFAIYFTTKLQKLREEVSAVTV